MTPEHKYIAERFERRTYIKGLFKGTFVGQLDPARSDEKYERFYDLEIIEGNITTTQDNISKWPDSKEPVEFVKVSRFLTRPGEVQVALQYLDGSVKHFKIKLHELKLINCALSKQVHKGNEVIGTIEGEVSGYVLHYDSTIEEVAEIRTVPAATPEPEKKTARHKQWQPNERLKKIVDYSNITNRSTYVPGVKTGCLPLFKWLFGISLLLGLIVIMRHLILILLFFLIGSLLVSRTYNWLANRFGLRMSVRRFTILYLLLIGSTIALIVNFYQRDKDNDRLTAITTAEAEQYKAKQQSLNRQNKDSFNHYFESGSTLARLRKYEPASQNFQRASLFVVSSADKDMVNNELAALFMAQADDLVKQERYVDAIKGYTNIINLAKAGADAFYKRARCYIAEGRLKEAVKDLKKAITLGDKPAMLLHDKVNPIRKKVVDIVTLCNDGSYSNAKGRGACSHHGGVREWNHKVYEEYREYE